MLCALADDTNIVVKRMFCGDAMPGYTRRMQGRRGCLGVLSGCLIKLLLGAVAAMAFVWLLTVVLNPWALHIGGRSTPLLYWHGSGKLLSKDGKTYPLYISFWPGRPMRNSSGRREGKGWSAHLSGTGYLCVAPGQIEKMQMSGTMYGGYSDSKDSLFDFRLLEWRKPFSINYQNRGYFDMAGMWHGQDLVMDRPNEQGIKLNTGPFIDHATVTLRWSDYYQFQMACKASGQGR